MIDHKRELLRPEIKGIFSELHALGYPTTDILTDRHGFIVKVQSGHRMIRTEGSGLMTCLRACLAEARTEKDEVECSRVVVSK